MFEPPSRLSQASAHSAEQWNGLLRESFGASVRRVAGNGSFAGQMRILSGGDGLLVADVESTGATIEHRSTARSWRDREYVLHIQVKGRSRTLQGGRELVTDELQGTIIDTARPYCVQFDEPTRIVVVRFPQPRIMAEHVEISQSAMVPLPANPAVLALAVSLIDGVWSAAAANYIGVLQDELTDALLALMMLARRNSDALPLIAASEREWLRIQAAIEENLDNPDLGGPFLAMDLNRSQRHVQGLFASRGQTVTEYIRERRLVLAAQCLTNPDHANRSATEICFSCGFRDLSYFTQLFKARFGLAPGRYRTARQQ